MKCNEWEIDLKELKEKMNKPETSTNELEGAVYEEKLEEVKKAWEEKHEAEKVNFRDVVEQQIQQRTRTKL